MISNLESQISNLRYQIKDPLTLTLSPGVPGARGPEAPILHFTFYVLRFTFLFLLATQPCLADDSVTLPLHGYYHPGKYMPVDVAVTPRSAAENSLNLTSPGSVWTFVRFEGGRIDTTVPWMPIDERARALEWYVPPRKGGAVVEPVLKPLDEHQRLVGYAGIDAESARSVAASIYPGDSLIAVPLNPAMPLPGSAAAWETLDAVVLDSAAAQRVGESRFANLVSSGVAFAIRGEAAPWPYWPWKREGLWQVLHFRPAGPSASAYDEAIYEPVASWRSGWPEEVRGGFMKLLVVYSIVVLLLALWKPRFAAVGAVICSGILLAGLSEWGKHRKPTQTVGGKVRLIGPGLTQDDDWAYQISHQDTTSVIPWVNTTRILFASAGQLDRSGARIVCYPSGDPDYVFYSLPAKTKIALLCRRCGPQAPNVTAQETTVTSPLAPLIKEAYLRPGDRILGEFPCASLIGERYAKVQQWQGVMIKRDGEGKSER